MLVTCWWYDCLDIQLRVNLFMMKIFHFSPPLIQNEQLILIEVFTLETTEVNVTSSGATTVWCRESDLTNNVICEYRPYKWGHPWQPGREIRCYLCWMCNGFAMESHTFRRKKHVGMCILSWYLFLFFILCVKLYSKHANLWWLFAVGLIVLCLMQFKCFFFLYINL